MVRKIKNQFCAIFSQFWIGRMGTPDNGLPGDFVIQKRFDYSDTLIQFVIIRPKMRFEVNHICQCSRQWTIEWAFFIDCSMVLLLTVKIQLCQRAFLSVHSFKRRARMCVSVGWLFEWDAVVDPKRSIFVCRKSWDLWISLSPHFYIKPIHFFSPIFIYPLPALPVSILFYFFFHLQRSNQWISTSFSLSRNSSNTTIQSSTYPVAFDADTAAFIVEKFHVRRPTTMILQSFPLLYRPFSHITQKPTTQIKKIIAKCPSTVILTKLAPAKGIHIINK